MENVNFDISIFPECLCHVIPYVTSMHLVSSGNTSVSRFPLPGHFCLGWQIPGEGNLELSNQLGWGRKKRANAPS